MRNKKIRFKINLMTEFKEWKFFYKKNKKYRFHTKVNSIIKLQKNIFLKYIYMEIYNKTPNSEYDDYYDWKTINDNLDVNEMEKIIFGEHLKNKSDILPENIDSILKKLSLESILDYGAGLGRNLPVLLNYSSNVDYIDLINYNNTFSKVIDSLNYSDKFYISDSLPESLNKNYSLIYASVVLQHIKKCDVYEGIIKILSNKCDYLLIVQNSDVKIKNCMNNYFELVYFCDDNKTFDGINHTFYFYKSKNNKTSLKIKPVTTESPEQSELPTVKPSIIIKKNNLL
jgi:hypothetical protein